VDLDETLTSVVVVIDLDTERFKYLHYLLRDHLPMQVAGEQAIVTWNYSKRDLFKLLNF